MCVIGQDVCQRSVCVSEVKMCMSEVKCMSKVKMCQRSRCQRSIYVSQVSVSEVNICVTGQGKMIAYTIMEVSQ